MRFLLLFTSLLSTTMAVSYIGCYPSLPSSFTDASSYKYQSSSCCSSVCSGYAYFALSDGGTCTCGSDAPSGATSSNCTVVCYGYGEQTCGGTNAYDVYSNANAVAVASCDARTASTIKTSSTSTEQTTTSTHVSTSAQETTGQPTTSAVSTQEQSGTTVVIYSTVAVNPTSTETSTTVVSGASSSSLSSSPSSSSSSSSASGTQHKSSVVGPAVGGTVGGLAAIGIGIIAFIFIRRRRVNKERDAELADSAYIGAIKRDNSQLNRPMSNPFLTKEELMVDQRLNPVMLGRRRISEGSLADEADYSRKILRVANPDDD